MTAVAAPNRHRTRRILIAAIITVGLGWLATLLVRRELDARRLAAVIAELDRTDPGWRFDDLERARPNIPDFENSAVVIDAAFAKLSLLAQAPLDTHDYLSERGLTPNTRLSPVQERELRDALELNAAAMPDILALAERPRGRHAVAYTTGVFMTPLTHLNRMTRVRNRILTPLGCRAVHDADVPRALTAFRARLNLGRSLRDEPLPWSQVGGASDYLRRAIRDLDFDNA